MRTASTPSGGWSFPADPSLSALEQPVFWRPELDPQVVILAPAPAPATPTTSWSPELWPGRVIEAHAGEERYLILRTATEEHRIVIASAVEPGAPVTPVIPMNQDALVRTEATLKFWRCISKTRAGPPKRASNARKSRACQSLRALDGRLAGASYRELAEALFSPQRTKQADWKTSSLRDTTIRLVRCGMALMRGDYRRLLRRGPPN